MNNDTNLREDVTDAFQGVVHPGNSKLLRHDGMDDMDIEFLYKDEGKSWESIDRSELDREYSCISSLSDEGLRFIIPCFLFKILDQEVNKIGEWTYSLLSVMASKGRGGLVLTKQQYDIIDKVFFSYMDKLEEPEPFHSETVLLLQKARSLLS